MVFPGGRWGRGVAGALERLVPQGGREWDRFKREDGRGRGGQSQGRSLAEAAYQTLRTTLCGASSATVPLDCSAAAVIHCCSLGTLVALLTK